MPSIGDTYIDEHWESDVLLTWNWTEDGETFHQVTLAEDATNLRYYVSPPGVWGWNFVSWVLPEDPTRMPIDPYSEAWNHVKAHIEHLRAAT
ncbi:hypothetical protein [Microbispora sp. NPDC049125]|uniref:hypothetical protein n=1 Tax=Microbispora sp. NPDC049125 TaxID=3154929 RepID=UPI0034672FC2